MKITMRLDHKSALVAQPGERLDGRELQAPVHVDVRIDAASLEDLARRAMRNKGRRAKDGPLTLRAVSVVQTGPDLQERARVHRIGDAERDHACVHGHGDCSRWADGPCFDELMHQHEADDPECPECEH